jgi:uncharacterized membrane protein
MGRSDHLSSVVAFPAGLSIATVDQRISAAQLVFASAMIALGVIGFVYGDFALVWQRIPIEHLPGRQAIAYATAAIELVVGIGLLRQRSSRLSSGILFLFLLLWAILLKLPAVVVVPQMEATWLGFGEIAVMLAGAWVLFASYAPPRGGAQWFMVGGHGIRAARVLFAIALPMIGLSHFFYSEQTAALVPAWLPHRVELAYFTGAASIATCICVLFAIVPRLAVTLEAIMLWLITLLVWAPAIVAAPTERTPWTAFIISAAIACGAWLVADSYRSVAWLAAGARARRLPVR